MTDLSDYTTEQNLARALLITAVNGGSNHWAHVHGPSVDCPPEQVRAEGIDAAERSVWRVELADISRAITKLIDMPYQCADPGFSVDPGLLRTCSETRTDARKRHLDKVVDLKPSPPQHPTTTGWSSSR